MEGKEIQIKEDRLKLQAAIRCVKALSLLSSLKSSQNHHFSTTNDEGEERDLLLRTIADLKIQLVRERLEKRKIRLCSLIEFVLQILVLLSLLSFILVVAF